MHTCRTRRRQEQAAIKFELAGILVDTFILDTPQAAVVEEDLDEEAITLEIEALNLAM